jgi:hypothetical protein
MTKKIVLLASMTPIDDERTWVFARHYVNMPMGGLMASLFGAFEYKMVQDQDKRIETAATEAASAQPEPTA